MMCMGDYEIEAPMYVNFIEEKKLYIQTNVGPNICKCMVSIINNNNDIKVPTCGYQNVIPLKY